MPDRPTMEERAIIYGSAQLLNKVLEHIQLAYAQTHNENDWLAIQEIKAFQQKVRDDELANIDEDVRELINHPDLYPYAAYIWAKEMRDKEMRDQEVS